MGLFSKKNIAELTVGVEGMHCPMCVKNLTRGLKETDGITAVVEEKSTIVKAALPEDYFSGEEYEKYTFLTEGD